jgi:hypothetical protein
VPLIEPQPSNSPKIAGAAPSASPDDVVLDGTERDTVGSVKDGEEPQDSGEKSEAQPGLGVDSPEGLTMEQLVCWGPLYIDACPRNRFFDVWSRRKHASARRRLKQNVKPGKRSC